MIVKITGQLHLTYVRNYEHFSDFLCQGNQKSLNWEIRKKKKEFQQQIFAWGTYYIPCVKNDFVK